MENNMEAPQKLKNRTTTWSRSPTSGCIYPKELKAGCQRDIYTSCMFTAAFSTTEEEVTSANSWMDEYNGVYIDSGIEFNLKKEEDPATCYNMDES